MPENGRLDICDIYKFFGVRPLDREHKEMCSARLGAPSYEGNGWWRIPLRPTEVDILDWEPEEDQVDLPENWKYKRGWHGTTLYAVAGLLRNGIASSCSKEEGHRFLAACPGIYLHKDGTARKTSSYVTYSWLPGRPGCYWGFVVEVVCDRTRKVKCEHRDQWVQKPGSVKMKALWVHGCNHVAMSSNNWF